MGLAALVGQVVHTNVNDINGNVRNVARNDVFSAKCQEALGNWFTQISPHGCHPLVGLEAVTSGKRYTD